jgi:hypothetical protein
MKLHKKGSFGSINIWQGKTRANLKGNLGQKHVRHTEFQ